MPNVDLSFNFFVTVPSPEVSEKGPIAPVFVQGLQEKLAHEGTPVELECIVQAEPKPQVKWLKASCKNQQKSNQEKTIRKTKNFLRFRMEKKSKRTTRTLCRPNSRMALAASASHQHGLPMQAVFGVKQQIQREVHERRHHCECCWLKRCQRNWYQNFCKDFDQHRQKRANQRCWNAKLLVNRNRM